MPWICTPSCDVVICCIVVVLLLIDVLSCDVSHSVLSCCLCCLCYCVGVQVHKLAQARKLIKQGCESCPEDKKVWKEAVLLAPPNEAKGIVATAIRHLPNSVSMWKLAASLETELAAKKVTESNESCVCQPHSSL